VLKINYRNTAQILGFARRFAANVLGAPGVQADDESAVLLPEDGGRQGVEPEIRKCVSFEGEAHATAEWLLVRKKAGCRCTARRGSNSRAWRSAAWAPSADTVRRSRTTSGSPTRATHEAFLTYSRVSPLVERLVA
jgi:hypothetical protein